ncbi:hypothetical protein A2U01_0096042, partial [Trifolium medium]|nr:hypothetical protein [Trifolium medium]
MLRSAGLKESGLPLLR